MSLVQAGRRAARQLSALTADGLRCFSAAAPGPDMMEVFVNDVSVHVPKGVSVLQVRCRREREQVRLYRDVHTFVTINGQLALHTLSYVCHDDTEHTMCNGVDQLVSVLCLC